MKIIVLIFCGIIFSNFLGAFDTAYWMRDLAQNIKDKPLNKITIPGSHDSATDKIAWHSPIAPQQDVPSWLQYLNLATGEIIANWSKAQGLSITSQLLSGIRYLDLRVAYKDDEKTHYSVHGMYSQKVSEIISEIKDFMNNHPMEIIILQIGDLRHMEVNGVDTNIELIKELYNNFSDRYIANTNSPNILIQNIWQTPRRIIIIYNDNRYPGRRFEIVPEDFLWSSNTISAPWANKDNVPELWSFLKTKAQEWQANPNKDYSFFGVQAVLTANIDTIKRGLDPFSPRSTPRSLWDLALLVRPKLTQILNSLGEQSNKSVIFIDFVNAEEVRKMIMLHNLSTVFVTSTAYYGELDGLAGADHLCNANAAFNPDLAGKTFKAWLSTSTTNAKDRIPDRAYGLVDGNMVALNKAQLTAGLTVFDLGTHLFSPIDLDEKGNKLSGDHNVLTGTGADGLGGILGKCDDWTTRSKFVGVTVGSTSKTTDEWTNHAMLTACDWPRHLYCFQDN